MKRPLTLHIAAIAISIVVAALAFLWVKSLDFQTESPHLIEVGSIAQIEGRLDHRPPGSAKTSTVTESVPLHHQELLITQRASSAQVNLKASSTLLRLNEGTRFIAELDPSKKNALLVTIIDGTVTVLEPGQTELIRVFKGGQEIALSQNSKGETLGAKTAPVIASDGSSTDLSQPEDFKLIVTATKSSVKARPSEASENSPEEERSSNVLSNEDIIRRLRAQSGLFQRCYLGHIHREQAKSPEASLASSQARTVVVSFTIQSSGRVNDSRIVRSDFKDTILHSCVGEVLERTIFRGFKGEPVPVREFPISFQ